jgi:hypothetical protein
MLETRFSNAGSGSLVMKDSKARFELFKEKYMPMMQLAIYWELMLSAEDMIMIFELEDLPAECKAPRLGIKSFRQESIRSQPDFVQHYCTESLIHAPSSDRRIFALFHWIQVDKNSTNHGKRATRVFDFSLKDDDEDSGILQTEGGGGSLPRDMQIGIFATKRPPRMSRQSTIWPEVERKTSPRQPSHASDDFSLERFC